MTENEMVDGITDSIDMSLCELMGSQRVSHDLVTEQHHHQKRDDIGREEGEGFRMGNTCIPVADSF